ncbi:MAG: hypothetical protein P1V97_00835 [Planctomycetota bacterium]|nr:hypothetical protein [Planctomycetota bacterium]
MSRVKKTLKVLGIGAAVLVLGLGVTAFVVHEARPKGVVDPEADKIAAQMLKASGATAWKSTNAVRWTFAGRNTHLWDRKNNRVEVKWQDYRVLLRCFQKTGKAWKAGVELTGADLDGALDKAHKLWINDAFWLNPIPKLFDSGVTRTLVKRDGKTGLLMEFARGGRTPGDAYLWHLNEQGLPESWQMWVKIIPIGGLKVTWSDWKTLSTGAKIATKHELGPVTLAITELEGAKTLKELCPDKDPFEELK